MAMTRSIRIAVLSAALASLCACTAQSPAPTPASDAPPPAAATATTAPAPAPAEAFSWPASFRVMGDGYPDAASDCRRLGESPATSNYLDDAAMLVGCPGGSDSAAAKALADNGAHVLGEVEGVTLLSVPMRDARTAAPTSP